MTVPLHDLTVVLTSFALRQEYMAELDGMIATVKRFHPTWPIVVGRGTNSDDQVIFELDSPIGRCRWIVPAPVFLNGSSEDWRKITRLKAWWISEVWREYGGLADPSRNRVLWLDADARLNGSLDFEVDPKAELIAGPWWVYPKEESAPDTIASGLLFLQGHQHGPVQDLLQTWRRECLIQAQDLPGSIPPWPDGDQEVLTWILEERLKSRHDFILHKLDFDRYCGAVNCDGTRIRGTLVDQWQMSRRMLHNQEGWPPPEESRKGPQDIPKPGR